MARRDSDFIGAPNCAEHYFRPIWVVRRKIGLVEMLCEMLRSAEQNFEARCERFAREMYQKADKIKEHRILI